MDINNDGRITDEEMTRYGKLLRSLAFSERDDEIFACCQRCITSLRSHPVAGKVFAALDELAKLPTEKQGFSSSEAQEVGWMLERDASKKLRQNASKWHRGKAR